MDGDDIGSVLELLLLDNGIESARSYSASVTRALTLVRDELADYQDVDILVSGGDDLVAALPDYGITVENVERLRDIFLGACGRTLSVGLGSSASEATQNLRRAKLMGKNAVVSMQPLTELVINAKA
jgi:hypothetical protein